MAFLPDTNVWISLLKNPGGKLEARVRSLPIAEVLLCSVVKAELWHGARKYGNRERRMRALDMLFAPFALSAFQFFSLSAFQLFREGFPFQLLVGAL